MFVGSARFVIHIPAAQTLKDRRRVVNRLKDRIRSRLSVSLCEVGDVERHQLAVIAIATVAREAEGCHRVIALARAMAETQPDAVLADVRSEVMSFGGAGDNLSDGIETLEFGDSRHSNGAITGDEPPNRRRLRKRHTK